MWVFANRSTEPNSALSQNFLPARRRKRAYDSPDKQEFFLCFSAPRDHMALNLISIFVLLFQDLIIGTVTQGVFVL
jgi:hypothetical protein